MSRETKRNVSEAGLRRAPAIGRRAKVSACALRPPPRAKSALRLLTVFPGSTWPFGRCGTSTSTGPPTTCMPHTPWGMGLTHPECLTHHAHSPQPLPCSSASCMHGAHPARQIRTLACVRARGRSCHVWLSGQSEAGLELRAWTTLRKPKWAGGREPQACRCACSRAWPCPRFGEDPAICITCMTCVSLCLCLLCVSMQRVRGVGGGSTTAPGRRSDVAGRKELSPHYSPV